MTAPTLREAARDLLSRARWWSGSGRVVEEKDCQALESALDSEKEEPKVERVEVWPRYCDWSEFRADHGPETGWRFYAERPIPAPKPKCDKCGREL